MKKMVFAFQVFGLIATIPLMVTCEMNHGTGSLPVSNINARIHENAKNAIAWEPGDFNQQFAPAVLFNAHSCKSQTKS